MLPATFTQDLEATIQGKRFFVRTLGIQGVEDVGDRGDSAFNWDVLT